MKQKIRKFVLSHSITRELFFLLCHKKLNKKLIDKKIKKLSGPKKKNRIGVIVSLTSYGERLNELQYTLYSLITQTVEPEKIFVNLAESDFIKIPSLLRKFEKFGVTYNKTEDLKSYKKLIPTLQMYPDHIIVTADDDLFYPKDWLEKLWKGHLRFPDVVICHSTLLIKPINDSISYRDWKYNKSFSKASFSNFILSGAGALFPLNCFYKDIDKQELFLQLAPFADDVWDYFMCILNHTKILQIKDSYYNLCYVNPYREYGIIKGSTLTQQNVYQNKNDEQIANIMNYYSLQNKQFIKIIKQ